MNSYGLIKQLDIDRRLALGQHVGGTRPQLNINAHMLVRVVNAGRLLLRNTVKSADEASNQFFII